jgi:GntR family transcriptional regulator/MocR family aminotransferase
MNLPLQLDRRAPIPLQDQLFEQLRQLILTGKLKPNSRVIATRFLAEQTGVSRTTVLLAYERLISEGYLETRPAIGTFVCSTPPGDPKRASAQDADLDIRRQAAVHPAAFQVSALPSVNRESLFDFSPSRFDASHLLPPKVWLRSMRNVFERDPDGLAKPQPDAGLRVLREVIVDYLASTRGIMTSPDRLIIVGGRRQACSLAAHLFQRRSDRVVVEAPGDDSIADFFKARGANLVHVPVDEHGMDTGHLPKGPVSLAYVTPVRQNPLGGTMTQARRTALIEWAREAGAYLIEDDSDSELRYHGTTPQPLTTLDPYGLVMYAGSFAKTLGAGLGLGYLVVPPQFVNAIVDIKSMSGDWCPWLEQMVVADLLTGGEYEHHLRRVRKIYLERRDALIHALRMHFGDVHLIGTEIGTQLTWLLPDRLASAQVVCDLARARGVHIEGVVGEAAKSGRFYDRALILGYAAMTPEQLRQGVAAFAEALNG